MLAHGYESAHPRRAVSVSIAPVWHKDLRASDASDEHGRGVHHQCAQRGMQLVDEHPRHVAQHCDTCPSCIMLHTAGVSRNFDASGLSTSPLPLSAHSAWVSIVCMVFDLLCLLRYMASLCVLYPN